MSAWKHCNHKISVYTWDQKVLILEIILFSIKQDGKKFFNSFGTVCWKRKKKKLNLKLLVITESWHVSDLQTSRFFTQHSSLPVGHAKQHHISEQHPPLMQKEACAIFFQLSLQDRTEVGCLSFLSQALIYIWFLVSCLTFIFTEQSLVEGLVNNYCAHFGGWVKTWPLLPQNGNEEADSF